MPGRALRGKQKVLLFHVFAKLRARARKAKRSLTISRDFHESNSLVHANWRPTAVGETAQSMAQG
jgi:hypothetical protein